MMMFLACLYMHILVIVSDIMYMYIFSFRSQSTKFSKLTYMYTYLKTNYSFIMTK